jgi:Ca2+-transporting ATPase
MALGAWRMSRVNVLARRPEVIETLGTATVICVDKTGTLTSNRMTVEGYYLGDLDAIAKAASFASALKPIDPMDIAFREKSELEGVVELVREYPLRADLLAVTHVWRLASGETYVAAKGAPEAIARMTGTAVPPEVALLAGKGLRVLAVAEARFEGKLPEDPAELGLKFVGLAALKDPVRPSVPAALAECYRAGIRTIMITGDYPNTALAIASEIGLECDAGALTGTEIAALSDAELAQKLTKVNVFARMLPEQKLRIIRALKTDGHVVAMTGDGVNDAPALKAADIGIAMGARGTDVAREAADLILTDDDFASIERGIKQGRGIFNNLRKAMTYIVAVHIPLLGMTLIPVFVSAWPLVLIPILIAALELIIDPACSVVFEAEEVDSNVMREKPRSAKEPVLRVRTLITAVLQGFGSLGLAVGVYLWALGSTFSSEEVRTVTFVSLVAMNLVLILSNRSKTLSIFASLRHRKNSSLKWLFSAVAVVISLLLFVPVIRDSFGLGVIGVAGWLAVSLATACALVWFEITKRLNR